MHIFARTPGLLLCLLFTFQFGNQSLCAFNGCVLMKVTPKEPTEPIKSRQAYFLTTAAPWKRTSVFKAHPTACTPHQPSISAWVSYSATETPFLVGQCFGCRAFCCHRITSPSLNTCSIGSCPRLEGLFQEGFPVSRFTPLWIICNPSSWANDPRMSK